MPPPNKSKKSKAANKPTVSAHGNIQEVYKAIQEAFDAFHEENGQPPSIYRLALLSGQSKYFCRQFLEQASRNPQQANDNRRQKSQMDLERAYLTYLKKHKKQPSIRILATLAKASHRSAQSYLNMLPTDLPKLTPGKPSKKNGVLTSSKARVLPTNLPKGLTTPTVLPFGKLTKLRRSKLAEAYQRYCAKRRVNDLCRADIGRIATMAGVDFWIALFYFRQQGLCAE